MDNLTKTKRRGRKAVARVIEHMESRVLMSTTIADWGFETNVPTAVTATADGSFAADSGTQASSSLSSGTHAGAAAFTGANAGNGSAHSFSANTWAVGDYYQFQTSTTGQSGIDFAFDQTSSNTGPGNFVLQYSTNGTTFTPIGSPYTVSANAAPNAWNITTRVTAAEFNFDLSSVTALNNQSAVYFRLVDNSTTSAANGTVATAGTDRIDNVIVAAGPGVPAVGSFSLSPAAVAVGAGTAVTLTAGNVVEGLGTGSISGVNFYRESTPAAENPAGDTLVGGGTNVPGTTNWTFSLNSGSLAAGSYSYYAVATDTNSNTADSSPATLTAANAQSINFSSATYTANETSADATITVNLSGTATNTTTVQYATSDGTAVAGNDYTAASGTLTINPGFSSGTFNVPLIDVKTFAGTTYLNLTLSNPNSFGLLGSTTSATLTITDNQIASQYGVGTPTASPDYTVQLTPSAAQEPNYYMSISYASTNGFGTADSDNTASMPYLEFANLGGTNSTIYPASPTSTGVVDSLELSLYNTATTGTFGGASGAFDVYLLSNDPAAAGSTPTYRYQGPSGTSTGADGNTGPTVIGSQGTPILVGTATFLNDQVGYDNFFFDGLTSNSSLQAALTTDLNTQAPIRFAIASHASSTIAADWYGNGDSTTLGHPVLNLLTEDAAPPPTIGSLTVTPGNVTVGTGASVTLTATNVAANNTIDTPNPTVAGVKFYNGSISSANLLGAGVQSGSNWSLTTSTSGFALGTYTIIAVATDTLGTASLASSATLNVNSAELFSFSSAIYTGNETDGTETITVDRTGSTNGIETVNYATSDGAHFTDPNNPNVDGGAVAGTDYTSTSGTLTFPNGASSETFSVPVLNVKTFAGTRTFNLTLSGASTGSGVGSIGTATMAITDNTVSVSSGIATPTSVTSYSTDIDATGVFDANSYIPISPASGNGFGSGTNVGPEMPFIEYSTGSTIYPTTYLAQTVDSVRLSLYNTTTTTEFSGLPGQFDVYLLTGDTAAPLSPVTYLYEGPNGTSTGANGNTGPTVIGSQGTPFKVGTATFTNNTVGYNDFTFDDLSSQVASALTAALNSQMPIRFVITPSQGSGVAADWEGNFTSDQPQLTLLVEKSSTVVENFSLATASDTVENNAGTETITVDRSSTTGDLSDTATLDYTLSDGLGVLGTDYNYTSSNHTVTFAAGSATATFTVQILTAVAQGDKSFSVTLSDPVTGNTSRLATLASPSTETVTILDSRTIDIDQSAGNLATVEATGPISGDNGVQFWNIEGTGGAAAASYGVADFNTSGLNFSVPTTIGTINQIFLNTINSPFSRTTSGPVDAYLVSDSTTSIAAGSSPLTFSTTANATEGLGAQLGTTNLLGSFNFSASQPTNQFTAFPLTLASGAALNMLVADLNGNAAFRIVLTPENTTVGATFVGEQFGTLSGLNPNPNGGYEAPVLSFNYTTASAATAPTLASSQVGDGTRQRSTVSSVTVVFNEKVNFNSSSFTLQQSQDDSNWTDVSSDVTASNPSGDGMTWVISCIAGGAADRTAGKTNAGLFANGIYQLTLHGSAITDAATGTAAFNGGSNQLVQFSFNNGASMKNAFAVLYGDSFGTSFINAANYGPFKSAFGTSTGTTGYVADLDYYGNGFINALDYGQFKSVFGAGYSFT